MFDGCTLILYFSHLDVIHSDQKLQFEKYQEGVYKYSSRYRGLHLKLIYRSKCCIVHGSIHKFWNRGKTNKDLFTIKNLLDALKVLYKELHMSECSNILFQGLEYGVNIELGYDSQKFIDSIIKIKGFEYMRGGVKYIVGRKDSDNSSSHEFKIYHQKIKYSIPDGASSTKIKSKDVLRFELKIRKMEKFDAIMSKACFPKINNFSDFIDASVLNILKDYLLEEFDNLMIWDKELVDKSLFKGKNLELFNKGCEASYWDNFKVEHTKRNKCRDAKNFNKLLDTNSPMKGEIRSQIIKKFETMFDVVELDLNNYRLWLKSIPEIGRCRHVNFKLSLTIKEAIKPDFEIAVYYPINKKDSKGIEYSTLTYEIIRIANTPKMSSLYYLDKVANLDKKEYCPITKLKRFILDPRGKYISYQEVKYYYNNYRGMYYKELYPRLPSQWRASTLKVQWKEIAQAIRNEASQKRRKENRIYNLKQKQFSFLD